MDENNFNRTKEYALSQLRQGLPAEYTYHNYSHTTDEVLPTARDLARLSGLTRHETRLLEIAAAYHDLGYADNPTEHE